MNDKQYKIFSDNLYRLMAEHRRNQTEVANAIGVSPQTFNTWIKGKAIPRMDKVQKLADYFGVPKSSLLEEQRSQTDERTEAIKKMVKNLSEKDFDRLISYARFLGKESDNNVG